GDRGAERRFRPKRAQRRVVGSRGVDRLERELASTLGQWEPQRERRASEPLDMLVEQDGTAAPDTERLERSRAAYDRLVVGKEDGLCRVDDTATCDGECEQAHTRTSDPIASSSGRALTHDSSISSSGSESQTMPPPTQRWMPPSATAKVRIVSASSKSPFGRITPSAPIAAPRPTGSSAAIRSSAAIFGAPVTEPPGKTASRISARPASGRSRPSTVETRCVTPASACWCCSSGQRTEPGSQT